MTREITVWEKTSEGTKGKYVTKKYFDNDSDCYDWFHENYGSEEFVYEKLG